MYLASSSAVVFGGASGWGKRVHDTLQHVVRNTQIIEIDASHQQIGEAIESSQIIFLAIPDDAIKDLLIDTENLFAKDKIVIDCATNKIEFEKTLRQIAVSGPSVCSTHPMVSPKNSPNGHNVLIMPVGNNSDAAEAAAKEIYTAMGMNIVDFDFDRHGDAMVILQMVPHLVDRILIDARAEGMSHRAKRIEVLSKLTPANYLLSELGLGRVATQRPDVSPGIIATGLRQAFGQQILDRIQSTLDRIKCLSDNRKELTELFKESLGHLDPSAEWRAEMEAKTEAALTRLENLRRRHFVVEAPK